MKKVSLSQLKSNLDNVFTNAIGKNLTFVINTENGNAVILSESKYNSLLESIYLNSQKGLVEKIKIGEKESLNDMAVYNPSESW